MGKKVAFHITPTLRSMEATSLLRLETTNNPTIGDFANRLFVSNEVTGDKYIAKVFISYHLFLTEELMDKYME